MAASKAAPPPAPKPTDSILLRHKRDSYYLVIAAFVVVNLLPLDEATAAYTLGPTAGAQEFAARHWRWILTILCRNVALCTIIYGGYHTIVYEGLGKIAIDATPGSKFNPEWPTADDISREKLYTYLGWLCCAAYEIVFIHLWASGALTYNAGFFTNAGGSFDAHLTGYHVLHIALVPYWRDFHFYFAHRGMHPWFDRKKGLLQGDIGAFLYRHVHSLHHKSYNPGPWSGLAMHPVEHLVYFSCALLPLFFRVHPLCLLFNLFHAAISPMAGHDGLTGEVGGGGFGHYLHHAHYEVNYGTVKVPLDRFAGSQVADWPRSKEGAVPGPPGLKEMVQVSVPLLMLCTARGLAPAGAVWTMS